MAAKKVNLSSEKSRTINKSIKKSEKTKSSQKNNPKKVPITEEMEDDLENAESDIKRLSEKLSGISVDDDDKIEIKSSKPVAQIKKGDKIKVDNLNLEVDSHYVLIDHGSTKEMAIELFDAKTDKDYQLRYFADQVERSIQFYELEEIIYNRKKIKRIEW